MKTFFLVDRTYNHCTTTVSLNTMSQMAPERSPRTLLDAACSLRDVLYNSSSRWNETEVVIEEAKEGEEVKPREVTTGFILHEVEHVLLEIRKDLDSPVGERTADMPLMARIRDHTNVIGMTLTGRALCCDDDNTTIVQLIADLDALRCSVENPPRMCTIL